MTRIAFLICLSLIGLIDASSPSKTLEFTLQKRDMNITDHKASYSQHKNTRNLEAV